MVLKYSCSLKKTNHKVTEAQLPTKMGFTPGCTVLPQGNTAEPQFEGIISISGIYHDRFSSYAHDAL